MRLNQYYDPNPIRILYNAAAVMVTCSGSLATTSCELRQAWKGATVTVTSGAGVWLGRVATYLKAGLRLEAVGTNYQPVLYLQPTASSLFFSDLVSLYEL